MAKRKPQTVDPSMLAGVLGIDMEGYQSQKQALIRKIMPFVESGQLSPQAAEDLLAQEMSRLGVGAPGPKFNMESSIPGPAEVKTAPQYRRRTGSFTNPDRTRPMRGQATEGLLNVLDPRQMEVAAGLEGSAPSVAGEAATNFRKGPNRFNRGARPRIDRAALAREAGEGGVLGPRIAKGAAASEAGLAGGAAARAAGGGALNKLIGLAGIAYLAPQLLQSGIDIYKEVTHNTDTDKMIKLEKERMRNDRLSNAMLIMDDSERGREASAEREHTGQMDRMERAAMRLMAGQQGNADTASGFVGQQGAIQQQGQQGPTHWLVDGGYL